MLLTAIIIQEPPDSVKVRLCGAIDVFEKAKNLRHTLTESCCTMLMYNLGYPINFIEGGFNNIKIVREEDLAMFGALVKK